MPGSFVLPGPLSLDMTPFIQNVSLDDVTTGRHMNAGINSMLIQIVDPGMDHPKPLHQFRHVAKFRFLDIEDHEEGVSEHGIFPAQAAQIGDLLRLALREGMNVIVHCVAGVCRSGAVAEAGVMIGFRDTGDYRAPNLRVKRMLASHLGLSFDPAQSPFNET